MTQHKNWRIEDQRRSENAADLLFRHTTVVSVSEVPEGEGMEDGNWSRPPRRRCIGAGTRMDLSFGLSTWIIGEKSR